MRYHGNCFQFMGINDTNVRPASDECSKEENYVDEHHAYSLKVQWFLYIPSSLTHVCSCILARMFKCMYKSGIK
jgi:hypothetical protein